MDETWIYFYDLETKEQSEKWTDSGSPCPKKVPNTVVSIHGDGICFVGQRWDTAGLLL